MITVHKVVVVLLYILGGLAGLAGAWTSATTKKNCRGLRCRARQTTHLYSFFESNNNDDNPSYSNNIQNRFNGNSNRNAESQLVPYSNSNRGDDLMNRPWHKDTYNSHFHYDNPTGNNNHSWLDSQLRRRRRRSMLFQETDRLFDELWQDSHRVFDRMNRLMDSLIVGTTTSSSNAMRTRRSSPFSLMDDLMLPLSPFSSSSNDMLERQLEEFLAVPSRSLLMRQQQDDNQRQISQLLQQAEQCLNKDSTCREIMGNPIQIDQVYSQSFSSCSVNGRLSQQQTQLECSVQGTNTERQGMVQLLATERGIQQLVLRVQDDDQGVYREIRVVDPSSLSSSSSNTPITGNNNDDNTNNNNSRRLPPEIVDAEII